MRISLCGRETAKAMIWAMSSAVIADETLWGAL
jgi:hypothetical protein